MRSASQGWRRVGALGIAMATAVTLAAAGCEAEDAPPVAPDATGDADTAGGEDVEDAALLAALEGLCDFDDHPGNPLIVPPDGEHLIGDPTVVLPEEGPDGRWHLIANSLLGLHHYTSDDGVAWQREGYAVATAGAFRPFLIRDGETWHLFYEQFTSLELDDSEIRRVEGTDLETWSEPQTVLTPTYAWQSSVQATIGNPYVRRAGDQWWMWYSADGVFQPDTGFYEPRVIGLARAPSLAGPWTSDPEPVIEPSPGDPFRDQGAGSIKLLDDPVNGALVALNNGIYRDEEGRSRSAIRVLTSPDGVRWGTVCDARPVIAPEGDGWKQAFVYAFDTVRVGDSLRVYYNARDGWAEGTERIGLAATVWPAP